MFTRYLLNECWLNMQKRSLGGIFPKWASPRCHQSAAESNVEGASRALEKPLGLEAGLVYPWNSSDCSLAAHWLRRRKRMADPGSRHTSTRSPEIAWKCMFRETLIYVGDYWAVNFYGWEHLCRENTEVFWPPPSSKQPFGFSNPSPLAPQRFGSKQSLT